MKNRFLIIFLMFGMMFINISCSVKLGNVVFETSYYKDDGNIVIDIPSESILLTSYEADFDNDGEKERLEIVLTGKDDVQSLNSPILFKMYKKDYYGEMNLASICYPISNEITSTINDGTIGKDRIDVFVDESDEYVKIYFEESGMSNSFADFKSFYFIGYNYLMFNFSQLSSPVYFLGSSPDLYEINSLIENYENPSGTDKLFVADYNYLKNFKQNFSYYNIETNNFGYDYPICENDKKFKRILRLYRSEENIENADEWLKNETEIGPFGKVVITKG